MNDFDQFIKNLGESEMPEYKEAYWKAFSKSAGFKSHTNAIVATSVVSAVLIGVAIWAGFHFGKSSTDPTETNAIAPIEDQVADTDTIPFSSTELLQDTASEPVEIPENMELSGSSPEIESSKTIAKPVVKPEIKEDTTPAITTRPMAKPAAEEPARKPYNESFYFNPDTIKYEREPIKSRNRERSAPKE